MPRNLCPYIPPLRNLIESIILIILGLVIIKFNKKMAQFSNGDDNPYLQTHRPDARKQHGGWGFIMVGVVIIVIGIICLVK